MNPPTMTVFGDLRANGIRFTRYLREIKGLDLQLILRSGIDEEWARSLSRPLDLNEPWVHILKRSDRNPFSMMKYLIGLRRLSGSHPLLWGRSGGGIISSFLGRPYIMQTVGSDVADMDSHQKWLRLLVLFALKRARLVLASQIRHLPILRNLNLPCVFLPLPVWDPPDKRNMKNLRPEGFDPVFFTSAHMYWNGIREIPKGNDRFLRAFAKFVHSSGSNACLIAVEHGPDIAEARNLINELNIADRVFFKKPMSQYELAQHYFSCDVVVDNFVCGEPGLATLDAMAYGLPVMVHVDKKAAYMAYGDDFPPVVNVHTEDEIFGAFLELLSEEYRKDLGESAKKWWRRNHHPDVSAERFISAVRNKVGGLDHPYGHFTESKRFFAPTLRSKQNAVPGIGRNDDQG